MSTCTPPCAVCGSGPTSACSRCLKVFYCGPACQREAWRGHGGAPAHKGLCHQALLGPDGPLPCSDDEEVKKALQNVALSGGLASMQAAAGASGVGIVRFMASGATSSFAVGSPDELAVLLKHKDTDPVAAFNLANRYAAGLGVARDLPASFACFLQAAKGKVAQAEYAVACMLSNGVGVPKDALASEKWMLKAARHGVADAQGNCALYFLEGRAGFRKDSARALQWAQAAAQQGHRMGQLVMAELAIDAGDNVGAAPWLQRAAAQGSPRAHMLLGLSLVHGIGRGVDVAAGLEHLRTAQAAPGFQLDESARQTLRMGQALGPVKLQSAMERAAASRTGKE